MSSPEADKRRGITKHKVVVLCSAYIPLTAIAPNIHCHHFSEVRCQEKSGYENIISNSKTRWIATSPSKKMVYKMSVAFNFFFFCQSMKENSMKVPYRLIYKQSKVIFFQVFVFLDRSAGFNLSMCVRIQELDYLVAPSSPVDRCTLRSVDKFAFSDKWMRSERAQGAG